MYLPCLMLLLMHNTFMFTSPGSWMNVNLMFIHPNTPSVVHPKLLSCSPGVHSLLDISQGKYSLF